VGFGGVRRLVGQGVQGAIGLDPLICQPKIYADNLAKTGGANCVLCKDLSFMCHASSTTFLLKIILFFTKG
jgi:hypothetical protein